MKLALLVRLGLDDDDRRPRCRENAIEAMFGLIKRQFLPLELLPEQPD